MAVTILNDRPSTFSEWGEGNPAPGTNIVEPPSEVQTATWQAGGFPPAPYMNWLHYISQKWEKNLDERAPRIPMMKWFVGAQSGCHFATIQDALASSDVLNGDFIYVSPSNANAFLTAAITISKSVRLYFEPGFRFFKSDAAATRALILNAGDIEIHGAEFSSGWSTAGNIAILLNSTARRCRIMGCKFDSSIDAFIDDSAVPSTYVPVIANNIVEY